MLDTLSRYLSAFPEERGKRAVRIPLETLMDRYSSQALSSAGLAINAAGAAFAKIGGAAFYAVANGVLVTLAAGAAMPALTAVAIPAGSVGVVCFFVDAGGNLTAAAGTPAPTLGGITWPQFPKRQALVGLLIITGAFVGGTTALDAGATVYLSPAGAFDPTALV